MAGRFEGKRALVTGAAGGVGASTVELLAAEGAAVVGLDLNAVGDVLACDVSDEASVRAAVATAAERLGGIDIVVNVAGIDQFRKFEDLDVATWQRHLGVNLTGPMLVSHAALPHLRESKGNIVTIASIAGLRAQPYQAAYCASKAGLIMLTKCMAVDGAKQNIRANCICPGFTNTPMIDGYFNDQPDPAAARKFAENLHPLGRLGEPVDHANAFVYLASDEANWVTGTELNVDGGITCGIWGG